MFDRDVRPQLGRVHGNLAPLPRDGGDNEGEGLWHCVLSDGTVVRHAATCFEYEYKHLLGESEDRNKEC